MPSANRCPQCRSTIHPFAATCENCGADLDAHRRRMSDRAIRGPALRLPSLDRDTTDLCVIALILVLLALFAPLFGLVFGLLVAVYASRNGLMMRRNVAIGATALSAFDLIAPTVLLPHLII